MTMYQYLCIDDGSFSLGKITIHRERKDIHKHQIKVVVSALIQCGQSASRIGCEVHREKLRSMQTSQDRV